MTRVPVSAFWRVERDFSDSEIELMDAPGQDPEALRRDLEEYRAAKPDFRRASDRGAAFQRLAGARKRVTLVDLASGYGDHARKPDRAQAARRGGSWRWWRSIFNFETLRIARRATPPGEKLSFVQADARRLPFRNGSADLVFCSLALHHFSDRRRAGRAAGDAARGADRRGLH